MRAKVMFNGTVYEGDVLRTTAKRLLVRFDTGTGYGARDGWFTKVDPVPIDKLVGRRGTGTALMAGYVTIPANSGFALEG